MPEASNGSEHPAMHGDLRLPGGTLAYEVRGEGPPVVFLHALIADHRMWEREVSLLSHDHRTVRFDLRGFGGSTPATSPFSYVEDLRALLSHLRLHRPYLVGASMGGGIAIDMALDHPELVGGLILAAPGLSGGVNPPFTKEEEAAFLEDDRRSKEVQQAWRNGQTDRARELLRLLWCPALEGPALKLFHQMVQQNSAEVFEDRTGRLAQSRPAEGRLSGIRVPTHVLVGDRDNPSSIPFARRIARSIPGARLTEVPGGDHLLNLSQPLAFEKVLRASLPSSA